MASSSSIPPVALGPLFHAMTYQDKDTDDNMMPDMHDMYKARQKTGYQPKELSQSHSSMSGAKGDSDGGAEEEKRDFLLTSRRYILDDGSR